VRDEAKIQKENRRRRFFLGETSPDGRAKKETLLAGPKTGWPGRGEHGSLKTNTQKEEWQTTNASTRRPGASRASRERNNRRVAPKKHAAVPLFNRGKNSQRESDTGSSRKEEKGGPPKARQGSGARHRPEQRQEKLSHPPRPTGSRGKSSVHWVGVRGENGSSRPEEGGPLPFRRRVGRPDFIRCAMAEEAA